MNCSTFPMRIKIRFLLVFFIFFSSLIQAEMHVGAAYTYDGFQRDYAFGPWHLFQLEAGREELLGRVHWAHRQTPGIQYEIESYPKFSEIGYAYLAAAYSAFSIFPTYRIGAEWYQVLWKGFESSAGLRYFDFPAQKVLIYTGSATAYLERYTFSLKGYASSADGSANILIRRYWDDVSYMGLVVGGGTLPPESTLALAQRPGFYMMGGEAKYELSRDVFGLTSILYRNEGASGSQITISTGVQSRIF